MTSRALRTHKSISFSSKSNGRNSDESGDSNNSVETAPTSVSESPRPSLKEVHRSEKIPVEPQKRRPRAVILHDDAPRFTHVCYDKTEVPRSISRHIKATDLGSEIIQEVYDEPDEYDDDQDFEYNIPEAYNEDPHNDTTIYSRVTTPQDFAEYFPSQRRLLIHHDDTTHDGNMNLKVETEEIQDHRKTMVQLYHLRMKDLEAREFSLRRYCRDSGREVCKTARRYQAPVSGVEKTVKNAIASLTPALTHSASKKSFMLKTPTREDSGYGSEHEEDYFNLYDDEIGSLMRSEAPTKSIKLEFSNYAQVDIKRAGGYTSKHYDFEYWGVYYSWRRIVFKTDGSTSVRYQLFRRGSREPIAHIVPVPQTETQRSEEQLKNGWVPPCSMWISDPSALTVFTDVAE